MTKEKVYLHAWTGDPQQATAAARRLYPEAEIEMLAHRDLRANGWKAQIAALRRVRGRALVYFFAKPEDNKQAELLIWTQLVHRCRETVVAFADGSNASYRSVDCARRILLMASALLCDCLTFVWCWMRLWSLAKRVPRRSTAAQQPGATSLDVAYLYPFPLNRYVAGGAMSHIRGVLCGLAQNGARCEVFSGSELPVASCPVRVIPRSRRAFLFGEALTLAYNWTFARKAARELASGRPSVLYQRHGRFAVAGALLSRKLGVPLILEYNGSEAWMSRHWDPTRFGALLRLAEDASLRAAAHVVVVCDASRQELIARGIPAERILVNPNGVDPQQFRPECGGDVVRRKLGIAPEEVVVGFLGTFSYWHGIETLQEATAKLLKAPPPTRLRFLFIGEGPLHAGMYAALQGHVDRGQVIFTGLLAHADVPRHLDAADILVSPHLEMPGGQAHFSSPTKLFEYMAMGKAIVASEIGQLAEVLAHHETAWLTPAGDAEALASAIHLLADNPELRARLGAAARAAAIARHTWKPNAARVLGLIKPAETTTDVHESTRIKPQPVLSDPS